MERVCRSFRVERGSSIKFGRSNSSLLISESISSECTRVARYENLSASMRMSNDQDIGYRSRKSRAYTFISKVFSFRKISSDCETRQQADMVTQEEKKEKKKRSSWLPDPERRWPVQGWWFTVKVKELGMAITKIINWVFIPPDLMWREDWRNLKEKDRKDYEEMLR